MRVRIAAALITLGLMGCEPGAVAQRPPSQFQADRHAMVTFTADPDGKCRAISGPVGPERILGCEYYGALVVANPCSATGSYAEVLCHELGHANGWRHD